MWSVCVSAQDMAAARRRVVEVKAWRRALAKQLLDTRRLIRAAPHAREFGRGRWLYNTLSNQDKRLLPHNPNPGLAHTVKEAWGTVRHYETHGVDLHGLPCGEDDAAYERAVAKYAYALAIVRDSGGRPLP